MIYEGLHQGLQNHLWLFYFAHFTEKIVAQLRPPRKEDSAHEFPSPFHYLLYIIVSTNADWIDEVQYVKDKTALRLDGDSLGDDNGYIPFSAALSIGRIITTIISSEKLDERFKGYMLEVVLRRLSKFQHVNDMKPLSRVLEKSLIYRDDIWTTDVRYRQELNRLYQNLDYFLRIETPHFENELARALSCKPDFREGRVSY